MSFQNYFNYKNQKDETNYFDGYESYVAHFLSAQKVVPLNINNLTPKWQHILIDTNFVQDTFGSNIRTPYTVCFPNEYKIQSNQLLINNHCISGHGNQHGNLIQNIDLNTGDMKWLRALNNDNYLVNQEFFPGMFYDSEQNQVVLKGFRKYGVPATEGFGWFGHQPSLASTIKLNGDAGMIEEHITNQNIGDTIKWRPLIGHFLKSSSNSYWFAKGDTFEGFHYSVSNLSDEQQLTNSLSYYPDRDFNLPYIIENIDNIYGTDDSNNIYGIVLQKEILQNEPLSIQLYKLYVNEKTSPSDASLDLKYKKDLSPYLRLPASFQGFFTRFRSFDENVYISMVYTDTLDNNAIKRWLLCLDADGNEKFYINAIRVEDKYPQSILYIGRKNGRTYFAVEGSDSDYSRIILSVDDSGNIQNHSKIQSGDINAKINGLRVMITDNDEIVLAAQVNSMYYYTACYDAKDFNIDFTNHADQLPYLNRKFDIYPNPCYDGINIKGYDLSQTHTQGSILILDLYGKILKSQEMKDSYSYVDISEIPNGIYFLKIISDKGEHLYNQKLLIMSQF